MVYSITNPNVAVETEELTDEKQLLDATIR